VPANDPYPWGLPRSATSEQTLRRVTARDKRGSVSKPQAQIVVRRPVSDGDPFRFDLVDVNGPRHGQRLADMEVIGVLGPSGARLQPDPSHEVSVRFALRRYGERNGYEVVE
jgi:hypothetical protein